MSSDLSVTTVSSSFDNSNSSINMESVEVLSTVTANDETFFSASYIYPFIDETASYWNAPGEKEYELDFGSDSNGIREVILTDYVEVYLGLAGNWTGVDIEVFGSKRGEIYTGSGHDTIYIGVTSTASSSTWSQKFIIDTDSGHDSITLENQSNSQYTELDINTGSGDDIIDISGLSAYYDGDASQRVLDGDSGHDTINGSEGAETIFGGSGDDIITALGGDDVIDGGYSTDTIYAGEGNDDVDGGSGDDFIYGGEGNDTIYAGSGDDVVEGGAGDDVIHAESGDNEIYGGDGDDIIYAGDDNDIIDAGTGNDVVYFDSSELLINGGTGLDVLIVDGYNMLDNITNFEAVIGESGSMEEIIDLQISEGLIVSLGGDSLDEISFRGVDSFNASDAQLSEEMSTFATSHNIDISNLNAYISNDGVTVWSDVDLLAS